MGSFLRPLLANSLMTELEQKVKINKLLKSYAVYQFRCPECNSKYIGKTERNLCVRLHIFNHISDCANYQYIKNLHCVENRSFDTYTILILSKKTQIPATNWNTLLII